jgi:hypothetical protein
MKILISKEVKGNVTRYCRADFDLELGECSSWLAGVEGKGMRE